MKWEGNRLLMDLMTNKVFSELTLSENFRMKLILNWGLEWELCGWKLIILSVFFCKTTSGLTAFTIRRPLQESSKD